MNAIDTELDRKRRLMLLDSIGRAYRYAGYRITDSDLVMLVDDVLDICKKYHKGKTLKAVCKAIIDGSMGLFGDYAGLSAKTINNFINSASIDRKVNVQKQDEEPETPHEERDVVADRRNLVNSCFNSYKERGIFFPPAQIILDQLQADGLFHIDETKIKQAKKMADEALVDMYIKERVSGRSVSLDAYLKQNMRTKVDKIIVCDFFDSKIQNESIY